jgi:hypothetical protein
MQSAISKFENHFGDCKLFDCWKEKEGKMLLKNKQTETVYG